MAIFQNRATLTYSGGTTDSNTVTGEITQVLSITKTALDDTYSLGDKITYIVSIVNGGAVAFSGLTLTDDLGAYPIGAGTAVPLVYESGTVRYFVNGVLQPTPTVSAEAPLTVTGLSVPAGGNAVIIYETRASAAAPLESGGAITNTASVDGGGLSAPLEGSETVTVLDAPDLSITKALEPAVVAENGQLTYTFVISNSGNTEASAADNIVLTDTFDPILENITVTLDGVALVEGVDYTYDEATGEFATVPGRITVPAATFSQDPITGAYTVTPGTATVRVTGTV